MVMMTNSLAKGDGATWVNVAGLLTYTASYQVCLVIGCIQLHGYTHMMRPTTSCLLHSWAGLLTFTASHEVQTVTTVF